MEDLKGTSVDDLQAEMASKKKLMSGILSAYNEEYNPAIVWNLRNSLECSYQEIMAIDQELIDRARLEAELSTRN